ncbi:MAG: LuxR C-terminal-related transcriptional regulator [Acidimicrobiales bacterium]
MADRLSECGVTRRELEVLVALGEHLTNAEIAARFFVSERTVESHVSSLLRKLQVSDRRELAHLVPPSPGVGRLDVRSSMPSGTLTFLFTDVEDSTALWEQFPRLMPQVLARHDGIVQDEISRHAGVVFAAEGDGFAAVFTSASAGAAGAVGAQQALAAEAWPAAVIVRVRMGLHSGTAMERDGNFFGGVVNRAARICASGRGGQTIVSAATAGLVADDRWTLVDLGAHRLKGLERPERLYRLDAPGLPSVDLPLRVGRERAGNLPHVRTPLLARDQQLEDLAQLLRDRWLVTVTGPGGVGKTRFAVAAAQACADRFVDGTWLVELGELVASDDVVPAVTTTMGLQPGAGRDPAVATAAALAGQRALLVLDNCEHVIDGVVDLVRAIASQCPDVTVLTTSREPLGIDDEQQFRLHPLGVDSDGRISEAGRLFCERAARVLGDFHPSTDEIAMVNDLCRRLDGLPLAIELAVARLPAMNLSELRDHLDDRFRLLTRRRGAVARQRSLRATVAWSYDLLTPIEQRFFDRLSVFSAEFGFGAAQAVGATPLVGVVEDLLGSLVDKSLLTTTRGPLGTRFRQLETLRQYGKQRLEVRDETIDARRQHLAYYVTWTETSNAGIRRPDELHWHQAFLAEWSNLRTALRWACELDDGDSACRLLTNVLWWANSRLRLETAGWCDAVLALPSTTDHPLRPIILAGGALFAHKRDDRQTEDRFLALARDEEDRLGPANEPWVPAAALNQWPGGPNAAVADAAALLRRADATGDAFWELTARLEEAFLLATLIRNSEGSPEGEKSRLTKIRETLDLAEAFGQPTGVATASTALGMALRKSEPTEALRLLERSLDLAAPLDVDISTAARHELASHYTQLGRPLDAVALTRPAFARHVRAGAWHEVWSAIVSLSPALADLGHTRPAATALGLLRSQTSDPAESYPDLAALERQLRAKLGAPELDRIVNEGTRISISQAADLLQAAMDELVV